MAAYSCRQETQSADSDLYLKRLPQLTPYATRRGFQILCSCLVGEAICRSRTTADTRRSLNPRASVLYQQPCHLTWPGNVHLSPVCHTDPGNPRCCTFLDRMVAFLPQPPRACSRPPPSTCGLMLRSCSLRTDVRQRSSWSFSYAATTYGSDTAIDLPAMLPNFGALRSVPPGFSSCSAFLRFLEPSYSLASSSTNTCDNNPASATSRL